MFKLRIRGMYLLWQDSVKSARVYINPMTPTGPGIVNDRDVYATTNNLGAVDLNIAAYYPGQHTLWIIPNQTTAEVVGPRTANGPDVDRIFRPLRIVFTIGSQNNVISATVHHSTLDYGKIGTVLDQGKDQELRISLRPIWIKAAYHPKRTQKLDMIVIHKTGDTTIGPSINTFLGGGASAHYIVDRDGHVLKMVRDEEVAGHASNENGHNQSHWGSQTSLSFRSIGIENVGTVKQDFEPAQYQSLIRLIHDLMAAHGIKRHRVVAHSDILTDGQHHMSAERIACPGFRFNWEMLETSKPPIGLARTGGNGHSANGNGNGGGRDLIDTFYLGPSIGKDLGIDTLITLKLGDWGPQLVGGKVKAPRWGGKEYKNITDVNISPIKQLQTYLADIGYSVGPATGQFNARTAHAVKHFQVHFEQRDSNDRINFRTASLIRDVWAANPKAD